VKLEWRSFALWILLVIGISGILVYAGIKLFSADPLGLTFYRGTYTTGFELSIFIPCGTDDEMWAEGNLQKIYDFISPIPPEGFVLGDTTEVYVEIKAKVSPPGSYGALGVFRRQIDMFEITKIQHEIPIFCR
jgi:hypothetical protein